MNNRRQFFRNLFKGIVVASAAPTILIPRGIGSYRWRSREGVTFVSKPIVAKVHKLKTIWTSECDQDFKAYYNINAEDTLREMLDENIKHGKFDFYRYIL